MDTNKKIFFLLSFIFLLFALKGCSKKEQYASDEISYEIAETRTVDEDMLTSESQSVMFTAPVVKEPNNPVDFASTKAASSENDGEKKFIRTAQLNLSVRDIVSAAHAIEDIIIEKKGFVIKSTINNQELYSRQTRISKDSLLVQTSYQQTGNLTLKVHHSQFDQTLRQIAAVAENISYRDVSANEITFSLLANQWRQKRQSDKSQRLKNISGPGKGHKLEDLIDAEEAIDRARESADNEKIAELQLNDQVEYSSITLTLAQDVVTLSTIKKMEEEPEAYRSSFIWKSLYAIKDGWYGLLDLVVGLLTVWPLLLIVGVAVGIAIRYRRRKRSK